MMTKEIMKVQGDGNRNGIDDCGGIGEKAMHNSSILRAG